MKKVIFSRRKNTNYNTKTLIGKNCTAIGGFNKFIFPCMLLSLFLVTIGTCLASGNEEEKICWDSEAVIVNFTLHCNENNWSDFRTSPLIASCQYNPPTIGVYFDNSNVCCGKVSAIGRTSMDLNIPSSDNNHESYAEAEAKICRNPTSECYDAYAQASATWKAWRTTVSPETIIFEWDKSKYDGINNADLYTGVNITCAKMTDPTALVTIESSTKSNGRVWCSCPSYTILGLQVNVSAHVNACEDKLHGKIHIDACGWKGCKKIKDPSSCTQNTELLLCAEDGGFRIKRTKGDDVPDGYIAGCFYGAGVNAGPYFLKDGNRSRWINAGPVLDKEERPTDKIDVIDVYTYDCENDLVEKRRYSESEIEGLNLKEFLNKNNTKYGELKDGKPSPPFKPPATAKELGDILGVVSSQTGQTVSRRNSTQRSTYVSEVAKTNSPGAAIMCMGYEGKEWIYGLIGNDLIGAMVSPGDTITFEGPGVASGYIKEGASSETYGGWQVKESSAGKVVFEATKRACFMDTATGFTIVATDTSIPGAISYHSAGNWIGLDGSIYGPCEANQCSTTTTVASTTSTISGSTTTTAPSLTTTTTSPVPDTTTTSTSPQTCISETLYGEHSEETELLRYLRDNVLSTTPEGQELIKLYYLLSPVIVEMMEKDESFKQAVKQVVDGILEVIEEAE